MNNEDQHPLPPDLLPDDELPPLPEGSPFPQDLDFFAITVFPDDLEDFFGPFTSLSLTSRSPAIGDDRFFRNWVYLAHTNAMYLSIPPEFKGEYLHASSMFQYSYFFTYSKAFNIVSEPFIAELLAMHFPVMPSQFPTSFITGKQILLSGTIIDILKSMYFLSFYMRHFSVYMNV